MFLVIASEAKQSIAPHVDPWIASFASLLAMTILLTPRPCCPEVFEIAHAITTFCHERPPLHFLQRII